MPKGEHERRKGSKSMPVHILHPHVLYQRRTGVLECAAGGRICKQRAWAGRVAFAVTPCRMHRSVERERPAVVEREASLTSKGAVKLTLASRAALDLG